MQKGKQDRLATFVLFVINAMIFFALYFAIHEVTHVVIAMKYGAENITVGIEPLGLVTRYDVNIIDEQDRRNLKLAQSFAETIGYHLIPFLLLGIMIFVHLQVKK